MEFSINTLLLVFMTSVVISMALIPIMVRLAPILGMIDEPDPRKVHAVPVPRVGGVGIVVGALVPIMIWLPIDTVLAWYLFGSVILLAFGIWDDIKELGHYVKFIGQFIAVLSIVYLGDVYVSHLPFMGLDTVSSTVGKPFTVMALIGMINAINHSDGLDGLAGGESLMSLTGIGYLAYLADGMSMVVIVVAVIGGVFGFLRYNSHPAHIFMGDGGSQFLGFTLGVLAVLLTQDVNPALSPAAPLLLLGLPIIDILSVFAQRIYRGMNWFRATKNHIHHRLLELGFHHYESVVIIYSIQALFVLCGVILCYESDSLLVGIYLGVCGLVFTLLILAEQRNWQAHRGQMNIPLVDFIRSVGRNPWFRTWPLLVIEACIALYLVVGSALITEVPQDFGMIAALLAVLLLLRLILGYRVWFLYLRLLMYVTIAFIVYLVNTNQPEYLAGPDIYTYLFFGVLIVAMVLAVRFVDNQLFRLTPLDYLVVMMVLVISLLPGLELQESGVVAMVVKLVILFYASELVIKHMKNRWNVMTVSGLVALVVSA